MRQIEQLHSLTVTSPSDTDTASPGGQEQPRAVMAQLADGFLDVRQGEMRSLLHEALRHGRGPAARQLFERADIEIAIVEEALEIRHVTGEKAPVLADAAAAHRGAPGVHQRGEELERALLCFGDTHPAGTHPGEEARGAVLALVPLIHAREHLIAVMDR